jgi:hypothetical protein
MSLAHFLAAQTAERVAAAAQDDLPDPFEFEQARAKAVLGILDEWASVNERLEEGDRMVGRAEGLGYACMQLAQAFADRPGFRDEWRLP